MTNRDIAKAFQLLGKLMEFHNENPFKYKSYINAYNVIRKFSEPLSGMSEADIATIPGLGKAISSKARALIDDGKMEALEAYLEKTAPDVVEMMQIRGFGPKKIKQITEQLQIETIGELIQACHENRLVALKGFGAKTQADLLDKLKYYSASKGFYLYAVVEDSIHDLDYYIRQGDFQNEVSLVGDFVLQQPIVKGIQMLVRASSKDAFLMHMRKSDRFVETDGLTWDGIAMHIESPKKEVEKKVRFLTSYHPNILQYLGASEEQVPNATIQDIFKHFNKLIVPSPQSEFARLALDVDLSHLISEKDIKGIIHCHSTYSDGFHSLSEMAAYAEEQGYEYLLITDHSKSAFYANGLSIERVLQQFEEIDRINAKFASQGSEFRVYRGIESDILSDGSLDYPDEILAQFDVVIASVHAGLNMNMEKATDRIVKAIENPYTRMLGHPTGRLLLSRKGYPLDFERIIEACAEHEVVIELNANPNRLDLDYTHIHACREAGVLLSINSDAHAREGIHVLKYGVLAARKAFVQPHENLSSFNHADFLAWMEA